MFHKVPLVFLVFGSQLSTKTQQGALRVYNKEGHYSPDFQDTGVTKGQRIYPSAIAVFPTPGSPMITGLFFVLRDSI